MEFYGHEYLADSLLAQNRNSNHWEASFAPMEMTELFSGSWDFDFFDHQIPTSIPTDSVPYDSSLELCSPPIHQPLPNFFTEIHPHPFGIESLSHTLFDSPVSGGPQITDTSFSLHEDTSTPSFSVQETRLQPADEPYLAEDMRGTCKLELKECPDSQIPLILGSQPRIERRNNKVRKKSDRQPSKNLMAERRRRKRLNDRLSMLRAMVPKISKLDRTSILGDTIDYMKELLQKINHLQYDNKFGPNHLNIMDMIKDMKPNEMLVRNTPKFTVERRKTDTRIEICCTGRPGLLSSTMSKLDELGLDIQGCVISCFNDFGMQASCSEKIEQRKAMTPADIKQALSRNAGYGGRCL